MKNKNMRKRHWICQCDCGHRMSVAESDILSGKVTSCGCEKLDNLLPYAPNITYRDDGGAECQFSTIADQNETFLVDAEDVDIVKRADWFKTVDGYVRGRDKETGEFYLLEEEIVYKHHDHFFNV